MSFFRKPTTGRFAEEVEYEAPQSPISEPAELDDFSAKETPSPMAGFGGVNLGASSLELKVVKPDKFEDMASVADHLMKKRTVVLNLESAAKDLARRMLDFLSGVAYAIDGQVNRVTSYTYIITPSNVDVSDGTAAQPEPVPANDADDDYFADVEG